jgi:membrane protein DedA with SNARE-associated domain
VIVGFPNPLRYAEAIELCLALLAVLYVAFKRYSHDRVILCEAIGVGIALIGVFVGVITRLSESSIWIIAVCGIAAALCGFCALYFAVANWAHRRRLRSHGK